MQCVSDSIACHWQVSHEEGKLRVQHPRRSMFSQEGEHLYQNHGASKAEYFDSQSRIHVQCFSCEKDDIPAIAQATSALLDISPDTI